MRLPQAIPLRSQLRSLSLVLLPAVVGGGAATAVLMLPRLVPNFPILPLPATIGIGVGVALLGALWASRRLLQPWQQLHAVAQAHRQKRFEHMPGSGLPAEARAIAEALSEHALARDRQQRATNETVQQATSSLRDQLASLRRSMRASEERADEQQRALDHQTQLLAGLSHELRTPLSAILGHAERLRTSQSSGEGQTHAESLYRCAQDLLGMINDLLDWSRITAGALTLHEVSFDLADTVEDALALIAPAACDKELELVHFIYHDVPTRLRGDPARLQQIMTNLLSNAVKYTERGEVVLRIMKESEGSEAVRLRLTVSDTGIGIPAEQQAQLFDAYSSAASGHPGSSTGLGLSIVKSLAEAMHGSVDVDSEADRGSTFGVTVQLERQRDHGIAPPAQSLRGTRAWLLEPSDTARLALTHSLDYWGVQWRVFDSGDALGEALGGTDNPPTFLILGLRTEELSERSVLSLLDTPAPGPSRVVLLRSAAPSDMQQALRCGADTALPKAVGRGALYRNLCAAAVGQQHGERPALASLRFLVADNATATRGLIAQMLREHGAEVVSAADGNEALERFEQTPCDGALLDLHMPGIDGLELMRRLRARDTSAQRPALVLMSAWFDAEEQRRAALSGADVVLTKPFDSRQLLRALAPWLRQRGAAQASSQPPDQSIDARLLQDAELREMLAEELPQQLAAVEESFAAGDATALREAAHALHGTAAFYHLHRLKAQAARVEQGVLRGGGAPAVTLAMRNDIATLRRDVTTTLSSLRAAAESG